MRSTFKVLFYVNGSKEKNGIVPIMGRVTINGSVAQFSCKQTIAKTVWDAKGNRAKGKSKEYYKKKIIELRAKIAKEKEDKKRDNAYYADKVKSASGPSNKAYYRKSKIDHAAAHDRRIEQWKREIESAKESLKRCK